MLPVLELETKKTLEEKRRKEKILFDVTSFLLYERRISLMT